MATGIIIQNLRHIARGKKARPGVVAELARDGYLTVDEYDSITFTALATRALKADQDKP